MAAVEFIQSTPVGTSFDPVAGETLIAIFAADAATAVFPVNAPATFQDTNGNLYNLLFYSPNNADIAGTFNMMAVYGCNKCAAGTTIVDIPLLLTPAGTTVTWGATLQYIMQFAALLGILNATNTGQAANFVLNPGIIPTNCIVVGGVFDAAQTGEPSFLTGGMFGGLNMPLDSSTPVLSASLAQQNTALGGAPSGSGSETVQVGAATDVFGFVLGIEATNATGMGAAGSLTFFIAKGPIPKPTLEGRSIATVQIDATQLLHSAIPANGISFPEFGYFNNGVTEAWKNYAVREFDLEHIGSQGGGLSECRYLIANSRPFYGPDLNGFNQDCPNGGGSFAVGIAFLTNLTTYQSVSLGGAAFRWADSLEGSMAVAEQMQVAMPANKGGLKFRLLFLNNLSSGVQGRGKFILNFLNYDLPSSFIDIVANGETT